MSYRSYTNKTLIQNWYEDRHAPSQPSKLYPSETAAREKEEAISCLTAAGVPKALNVLKRQQKWNTTGVIPDDGYRDMYTINKTEIPDPMKTKQEISKPPGHMDREGNTYQSLQKQNITHLTHTERTLPGPMDGFGAVLPKHPDTWDKRYFDTSYGNFTQNLQDFNDKAKSRSVGKGNNEEVAHFVTTNQTFYNTAKGMIGQSAGLTYKPGYLDSLKEKSELLCAEKLRTSEDPQHNTIIQRTWLPTQDPGVKARMTVRDLGVPQVDNENSLPLGTGNYFTQERKQDPGAYRKVRSEITTAPVEHIRMALR